MNTNREVTWGANVSNTIFSHVLNKTRFVFPETCQHDLEISYHPKSLTKLFLVIPAGG